MIPDDAGLVSTQPAALQRLESLWGQVEYLDAGSGPPLLYLHGTGAAGDAALLLEEPLLEAGFRLIIPHRPGYFGTVRGPRGSAEFCARLCADLLDRLGIGRVGVIGTSGGGMPAACFARCYPDRTAALVLQCAESHEWDDARWLPGGLVPPPMLFRHRLFHPLLRWQNRRAARAAHRAPLACLRRMSGSRFAEVQDDPEALKTMGLLAAMMRRCAELPQGIENDWAILTGNNGLGHGAIPCPTLILHDPLDPLVPFAHAQWSQVCIPQARLLELHAAGHLIWFGPQAGAMHAERVAFLRQTLSA